METLNFLAQGFDVALRPINLLVALFGAFIGTVVGLLPGLGPINGVAILLPLAFALGLPPETALILLAAVYLGCEYGGRISAILLNVPGDAAAIMTTLDGYPLARQGKAGIALSLSAVSSFIGSTIATMGVVLFAPILANWAVAFGPAEYFVAILLFPVGLLIGLFWLLARDRKGGEMFKISALCTVIGAVGATLYWQYFVRETEGGPKGGPVAANSSEQSPPSSA